MSSEKKNQNSPESLTTEQEIALQVEMNRLVFANMQLTRLAWILVQKLGGKTEIDLTKIPILWQLNKTKGEEQNVIRLEAIELPEPDEDQIRRVASYLQGTERPTADAMKEFELHYYPLPYIELRLSRYVRYTDGWWRQVNDTEQRN